MTVPVIWGSVIRTITILEVGLVVLKSPVTTLMAVQKMMQMKLGGLDLVEAELEVEEDSEVEVEEDSEMVREEKVSFCFLSDVFCFMQSLLSPQTFCLFLSLLQSYFLSSSHFPFFRMFSFSLCFSISPLFFSPFPPLILALSLLPSISLFSASFLSFSLCLSLFSFCCCVYLHSLHK